ncbi:MAG: tetratricopeptide repeat protein, partial [Acidobacteriota bacterium]
IAAVDAEIGRLLAELDRLGQKDRTVVAAVGDHGEALGEHGELTHGLLLYEPSLHVPWLVRGPGLPLSFTVETPVSIVSLAPTLASLLGVPLQSADGRALDGRDLTADLRSRRLPAAADLYAESLYASVFGWSPLTSLRRGALKYIEAPGPELYNLDDDPLERNNLLDRQAAGELPERLAAYARSAVPAPTAVIDAESRAKLASLGYLAGSSNPTAAPAKGGKDPKEMVALFRAFEEAHWALNDGRLEEAQEKLARLVAADPENAVFVGQLAEVSRRRGKYEQAVASYRKAVALAPEDREARYNLAVTLQEAGHHDEAFEALKTAIQLDPKRPEAHNALGIVLSLRGDLAEARDEFLRTTELDARNARAFNNLGNVLRGLRQLDEAEKAYRRAVGLAADYADPENGLGTLAVERDRPAEAVPHFERALALAPELHEARLNRGIALQLAGQRTAAITAFRDFLEKSGGDTQFQAQREAARQLLARLESGG